MGSVIVTSEMTTNVFFLKSELTDVQMDGFTQCLYTVIIKEVYNINKSVIDNVPWYNTANTIYF